MFLPPSDILLLASYLSHLCFYVSSYLAFFFQGTPGNIIRQTLTKRKLLHGIPAPEVGLHPPTYEYVSKAHGVGYLLTIYDFKSHQPSGLRWFRVVYFPHPPSPLPSGTGLPLPLPLHWDVPP